MIYVLLLDWMSRHDLVLSSVTPLIARKEYRKYDTPLRGVTVEDDDEDNISSGFYAATTNLVTDNLI